MDIRTRHSPNPKTRTVRLERRGPYRYDFPTESGHVVSTDEGTHLGGGGQAPTSLETITAALASCQTVQVVRIAEAMRFDLRDLDVTCATRTEPRPSAAGNDRVSRFTAARIEIAFATAEPEKRVERLKALAVDRCPIGALFDAAGVAPEIVWNVRRVAA